MDAIDSIKASLNYDAETGSFTWRIRKGARGLAGSIAGSIHTAGYRTVKIDGVHYRACRLAFLLTLGQWPNGDVDHINGVKSDDRWSNLRDVSTQINCQNQIRARTDSSSGLLGAFWDKKREKWYSKLTLTDGSKKWLGTFPDALSAHQAYLAAKRINHEGCTL